MQGDNREVSILTNGSSRLSFK